MSSWARWTDDFLQNSVSNLIGILKYKTERRKKLTSGLYPVYSLWQACCCWSGAWKIGLREPFLGWDGRRRRLLMLLLLLLWVGRGLGGGWVVPVGLVVGGGGGGGVVVVVLFVVVVVV